MSRVREYLKEKEIEIKREDDIKNLRQMAVDVIHFSIDQDQISERRSTEADRMVTVYRGLKRELKPKVAEDDSDDPKNYKFADKKKKA